MKPVKILWSGWVILILTAVFSAAAGAAVVGRLTQLEGRVDLLKGGTLPAIPLKVDDTVEPGDVVRTKSLSKARITFIDNSALTLSPECRIVIEEFKFEPGQGKRRAVLEIFHGLVLVAVNKILKTEEPDFIVKTQTAIVGVRGTEFGIRLQPNSSTILNFSGRTQVGNIFPEVSRLFLKAFKVAFATGSWNNGSGRWVQLRDMQGTTVGRNLPPTLPFTVTPQDQMLFMRQLTTFAATQRQNHYPPATPGTVSNLPVLLTPPGVQGTLNTLTAVTVPPRWRRRPRPCRHRRPRPPRPAPGPGRLTRTASPCLNRGGKAPIFSGRPLKLFTSAPDLLMMASVPGQVAGKGGMAKGGAASRSYCPRAPLQA